MKFSTQALCLTIGAALSFNVFATSTGSGVRGGGQTIDIDSTPYLMDLVSKSVCEWKQGSEFINELPALKDTLKKLDQLDWYFSADLRDELSSLNFCMTGPLYKVSPYDYNSVVNPAPGEVTKQAGYRLYENAYIDNDNFIRMNDVNKAMLIIHETMHSYLSMNIEDRSLKLRSMVKALDKVRSGEISTREKLHYNMSRNEIMFPLSVGSLEKRKTAVLFLKSSTDYKRKAILNTANLDDLINLQDWESIALTPWDNYKFGRDYQRSLILRTDLVDVMKNLSVSELDSFLKVKNLRRVNLALVAMNDFYLFSDEQKKIILESDKLASLIDSGLDEILNEKLASKNYLITASGNFKDLTTNLDDVQEGPVVDLSRAQTLPRRLMWLAIMMETLQENQSLSTLTANEKFYTALGLKNQKAQVQTMEVKIERERKVALTTLGNLSNGLVTALLEQLKKSMSAYEYNEILKQIDLNNF